MHVRMLLVGLLSALIGQTAVAEVQYPVASIAWEAPPACPDELDVVRQIEALLGEALQHAKPQGLRFVALVQAPQGADYHAQLRVSGGSEELVRELTHPSCDKLSEAVSLVIALAIDPERVQAVQRQRAPVEANPEGAVTHAVPPAMPPAAGNAASNQPSPVEPSPAPGSPPAATPSAAVLDAAPEPAPNAPSEVGVVVSGAALAGAGVLPEVSFGGELGFGATVGRRWSLGAFVELWAPTEEPMPDTAGGTLRMRQLTLGARGCWLPELGELTGLGCLGGEAAQLTGEGQNVANAHENTAAWAGLRAEVGVLLPLGSHVHLMAGGAGGVSLLRPRFGLFSEEGAEVETFQPSAWYVRGKVGALLTFD